MNMMEWVICPICNNKTRIKIRKDTQLKNFPLYCLQITLKRNASSATAERLFHF